MHVISDPYYFLRKVCLSIKPHCDVPRDMRQALIKREVLFGGRFAILIKIRISTCHRRVCIPWRSMHVNFPESGTSSVHPRHTCCTPSRENWLDTPTRSMQLAHHKRAALETREGQKQR